MCAPLTFLERLTAIIAEPAPIPRDFHAAAHHLASIGYDNLAILDAIQHLSMFGSAECCPSIDLEDREAIEALLPDRPYAEWAAFDDHVYGLGRGA